MDSYTGFEIAVIGISARFPGARDKEQFWNNLSKGIESIAFFTDEELLGEGEDIARIKDPAYVKANGYLENKEHFDSAFFGYTPDEATLMDPQTRLLHESVWAAIEDAGYDIYRCKSRIGLFSGATPNPNWINYANIRNFERLVDPYSLTYLSDANFTNTKISYLLNLRGPSVTIHTACSTSLVAVHQACNSLLLGECEMAAAGGITITNYAKRGYLYREGMIYSKDGHCHTFDEDASGTVGGEGVGIVLLKRLKKAVEDHDNIYAIIKGTGVNNDGNNKVGYTAPSVDGQVHAIMMARKMAKIPAASITYVEAHGTGTKLGDPIEVEALTRAFGKSEEKYCALGSVKTNIGHADCAAGIAGFIKAVLAIKHRQIPPSLNFKSPNPKIDFAGSPFYVNTGLKEWTHREYPLRAGVSSFGIGGTNAHVILEEAPVRQPSSNSRSYQALLFSAKTPTALEKNIRNMTDYLAAHEAAGLADLAFTMQLGRAVFPYRAMAVCSDRQDALRVLTAKASPTAHVGVHHKPLVVFMFPGQGSQYAGMCQDLYENEACFRNEVDRCLEIIQRISGVHLRPVIFPGDEIADRGEINSTQFTQPALFVIEYALAQLLIKWGVTPAAMIGHSIGEYVAACISGVFSLEDALALVLKRGALMQKVKSGIMLSISISEEKLREEIRDRKDLSLAAVNSDQHCVVSGEENAVIAFQAVLERAGIKSRVIRTSHAFHSYMMDEIVHAFEQEISRYKINPIGIPFVANLTGKMATTEVVSSPGYWSRHIRDTVRFSDGVEALLHDHANVFLEVGPGNVLSTFVRSKNSPHPYHVINLVRRPGKKGNDVFRLLTALGNIWLRGVAPDWHSFYQDERRHRVPLPTYAFDEIAYPVKVDSYAMLSSIQEGGTSKKNDISEWYYVPTWKLSPIRNQQPAPAGRGYLIFSDAMGIGDAICEKLAAVGQKVIRVCQGQDAVGSSVSYSLDPQNEESYSRLFEGLAIQGMTPNVIVYCWNITHVSDEDIQSKGFVQYGKVLYGSLVNIVKAVRQFGGLHDKRFVVLTNGVHNVMEGEPAHPIQSLVTGLLKVISQEHPSIQCNHIDIPRCGPYDERLIKELLYEVETTQYGHVVTFRNSRRWALMYDKITGLQEGTPGCFRRNGVYLITGGLGDLGFQLALGLITRYQAKLILLGRTNLLAAKNGEAMRQENNADEKMKEKLERFRVLRSYEQMTRYYPCNVAQVDELMHVVQQAEQIAGPINGVIHAAGVAIKNVEKPVAELTIEDLLVHAETKVYGLNALKTVFAEKELDFCVLTSSLSAVLGGLGLAPYVAANTYMDNFVRLHRERGELSHWVSLNLDGLDFDGTMSNGIDGSEVFLTIETAVLLKEVPQVVVSATDLGKRLTGWINRDPYKSDSAESIKVEIQAGGHVSGGEAENTLSRLEEGLLQVWQQFFGKSNISIDDNFFEIGGDSLKALTMIERIRHKLKVDVSIKEFFEYASVRELTERIKELQSQATEEAIQRVIPKVEKRKYYPASSAQERMLYEQMSYDKSVLNNISRIFTITEAVDLRKLEKAFRQLISRHEALRTSIEIDGGSIVQRVHEDIDFTLTVLTDRRYQTVSEAFNEWNLPFDLSSPPLLRCVVVKGPDNDNLLLVNSHHVVCDRISMNVMMNDFIDIYSGRELRPLDFRYVDYSFWQKGQGPYLAKQRDFWTKQLSGFQRINLPVMHDRETINIYEGDRRIHIFSKDHTALIKKYAAMENVSDFMFMLAVFYIFLSKVSGDKDIIVGTDAVGVTREEFKDIVGSFINALPLRLTVPDNVSFAEFLARVKSRVLEALDNQDFQYDQMNALADEQESQQIIDVYFSYTNKIQNEHALLDLGFTPFKVERMEITTRYELEANVLELDGRFNLTLLYSTSLYDGDTIELFMNYYISILFAILENNAIALGDISLERSINPLYQG